MPTSVDNTHHPGQLIGRQLQIAAVVFPVLAKPQLLEPSERLSSAARSRSPNGAVPDKTTAAMALRHDRAVIGERQPALSRSLLQLLRLPGFKYSRGCGAGDGFELQFGGNPRPVKSTPARQENFAVFNGERRRPA
jgi:hypothetical protein